MELYEESVFGISHANRQVGNDNGYEICSATENDPTADDVYDEEAKTKVIGGEYSAGDEDQDNAFFVIDVSKDGRIVLEDKDQNFVRRTYISRGRSVPTATDDQIVA